MAKQSARPRKPAAQRSVARKRFYIDFHLQPGDVTLPGAFCYAENIEDAQHLADQRAIELETVLNGSKSLASILQVDARVKEGTGRPVHVPAAAPTAPAPAAAGPAAPPAQPRQPVAASAPAGRVA